MKHYIVGMALAAFFVRDTATSIAILALAILHHAERSGGTEGR